MSYALEDIINEHVKKLSGVSGNFTYDIWLYDEVKHRLDGPAVSSWELCLPGNYKEPHKEWWFHGIRIECSSQEEFEKWLTLKAFW